MQVCKNCAPGREQRELVNVAPDSDLHFRQPALLPADRKHLSAEHAKCCEAVGSLANGERLGREALSERRTRPLPQVLRELRIRRDEVIVALDRLPDSALTRSQFGRTLVQITAAHDSEHASAILRWRWRSQEGL